MGVELPAGWYTACSAKKVFGLSHCMELIRAVPTFYIQFTITILQSGLTDSFILSRTCPGNSHSCGGCSLWYGDGIRTIKHEFGYEISISNVNHCQFIFHQCKNTNKLI